jgi:hypothetical protein
MHRTFSSPALTGLTRREFIARLMRFGAISPLLGIGTASLGSVLQQLPPVHAEPPYKLSLYDEVLLNDYEQAACLYFWEQSNPNTGLAKDRSTPSEFDDYNIASIASTGFGLTALCIADKRGFIPTRSIISRVRAALKFLATRMYNQRGFFYHFVDINTGERSFECEVSSIDTALLLCGVLTCREYFSDSQIRELATQIFDRVDWFWMLDSGRTLSHGWTPEHGFLPYRWNTYCELMLMYLMAIGSRTHAIPATSWDAWWRPIFDYKGLRYIGSYAPLFVHQYSHAWFDFRGKRDRYANYFENSVLATKAHRLFCIDLHPRFPDFADNMWGVTASDSMDGYTWWGGPPPVGTIDGTLVPAAPAGSLPFLPRETLLVLHTMRRRYGKKLWRRYAFQDAFNPLKNWYNSEVVGINTGIGVLMAENLRSGLIWETFMKNPEAQAGMRLAGFHPETPANEPQSNPAPSEAVLS